MQTLLERAGTSVDRLSQCTFFLPDAEARPVVEQVWRELVPQSDQPGPALYFLSPALGGGGVRLEIIATLPEG